MFCIIAFVVLSIIAIFNASYRELAKEAYDCIFRRITRRPCNTGFKEKIKAKIIGKALNKSPLVAKLLNKHFELFSWILFITTIVSIFWVGKGLFNFYMYGSCNGLNKSGFCALDPKGENNKVSTTGGSCGVSEGDENKVTLKNVNLKLFPTKNFDSKKTLVFIGCYSCDYTRKAYPLIKRLISENEVKYVFAHYPVKEETLYLLPINYCTYKQNPDNYWQLNDQLFESNKEDIAKRDFIDTLLLKNGYNIKEINSCISSSEAQSAVVEQRIELEKTNIYGTPLVFINGEGLVGPKPYRVYKRILNGW